MNKMNLNRLNSYGFTIVELMVTMVILSIIMGLVYASFRTMVTNTKNEAKSIEAIMDTMVGLEIIRLDIEHAGFGLAEQGGASDQEPCGYPIRRITSSSSATGCTKTDTVTSGTGFSLVIRSTINTTNQDTYGWFHCNDGNRTVDARGNTSNNYAVLLTTDKKINNTGGSVSTCPGSGTLIGYPYANPGPATQCDRQYCNRITYRLSTTQPLPACFASTRNLLRAVGADAGDPILQCVATWAVRFDLDTNGDGAIDQRFQTNPYAGATESAANIRAQLKAVHVYILLQDSQFDPDYNGAYTQAMLTVDGVDLSKDVQGNNLITGNFNNYKWKVVKITANPMNL